MPTTNLLTNFAVGRRAHRLAAVELVPGPHACAQVRAIADRCGTFKPQDIPLLPVWDCDRDERCECGWHAVEKEQETEG